MLHWCLTALSQRRIIGTIFFQGDVLAKEIISILFYLLFFLIGTLTSQRYRAEILQPFISIAWWRSKYSQQDKATYLCTVEKLNLLREIFGDNIINRNTEILGYTLIWFHTVFSVALSTKQHISNSCIQFEWYTTKN